MHVQVWIEKEILNDDKPLRTVLIVSLISSLNSAGEHTQSMWLAENMLGIIWLIPLLCSIFDYFPVAGPGLQDRDRCGTGPRAFLDTAQGSVHSESIYSAILHHALYKV